MEYSLQRQASTCCPESEHHVYFCIGNPRDNGMWDDSYPVRILCKSIAGRYRPVRVADGPITARCRFIKNASWVHCLLSNDVFMAKVISLNDFTLNNKQI